MKKTSKKPSYCRLGNMTRNNNCWSGKILQYYVAASMHPSENTGSSPSQCYIFMI